MGYHLHAVGYDLEAEVMVAADSLTAIADRIRRLAWLREQARAMRARGWDKRHIAHNLGLSLRTVQRYTEGME